MFCNTLYQALLYPNHPTPLHYHHDGALCMDLAMVVTVLMHKRAKERGRGEEKVEGVRGFTILIDR